ncbi:hypothetical protein K1719_010222 [Acacia pycnantha]|nr:hypothetical protein K1719_010222 [Acacia pycnantha]
MLSSISEFQKKIWDKWNVRLVILFSLFLQIFLIVSAPSRKRTRRRIFVSFVWLAYLLADWAAGFCIGLISNNQEQKSSLSQNDYLMAFWGPFLLLHLGGPDTISAFALEDNELWLRHLFALIFQSLTTGYVFLLTVPHNTTLWLPTILMFVAGLIKYAERIIALYVAAVDNFKNSLLPHPDAGPNYAKLMEEHSSKQEAGLPAEIIVIPELHQRSDNIAEQKNDRNDDDAKLVEEHSSKLEAGLPAENNTLKLVQKAFSFFCKFQGLIVDMIYSFKDRLDSKEYFQSKTPKEALMLIEIELNFMYEVFYTKASVIRQHWFCFWGKFVSLMLIMATLVLFIKEERHGNDFNKLDVRVTYALLSGALFLDVMALVMRVFTDYTATLSDESLIESGQASFYQKFRIRVFKRLNEGFLGCFLRLRKPNWSKIDEGAYQGCEKLSTKFIFRRWSGSIPGYNLLKYCLDESVPRVLNNRQVHSGASDKIRPMQIFNTICQLIQRVRFKIVVSIKDSFYQRDKHSRFKEFFDQLRYQSTNPFLIELWEYIFCKLKEKSREAEDIEAIQRVCSARGERVIQKMLQDSEQLERLKPFVDPNEVTFDESLLLWHIATTLCYAVDDNTMKQLKISMLLSDYMLYLLIMQPNMMSAIAGIGQKRFQDTCEEAKIFFKKRVSGDKEAMLEEACKALKEVPTEQNPIDVKGDRSKSLLFDACRLAKELEKLGDQKKREIITCVWVELLSYAACHCRPMGHVQLLSKGGELISFVWLLMVHLGLGTQFQIKEGDARAKLIVGK